MKAIFRYICLQILCISSTALPLAAQVGIGTATPAGSAVLDLSSTQKGFLPPRMNSVQRDAIPNPQNGLVIYNTEERALNIFTGDYWESSKTGISINPCVSPQPFSLGGSAIVLPTSVDVDKEGNYWIAGSFSGTGSFGTLEATSAGGFDMFIVKASPVGEVLMLATGGTVGFEAIRRIRVGEDGDIFIAGTISGNFQFLGEPLMVAQGSRDVFVARITPEGTIGWLQYGKLDGEGELQDMVLNTDGTIFLSGRFTGLMNPANGLSIASPGSTRFFLASLAPNGQWVFVRTSAGTSTASNITRLAVRGDFLYATGTFENGTLNVGNTLNTTEASNVFLARFQANGNFVWGKKGSAGNQVFEGPITVHPLGHVYWGIMFQGSQFSIDNGTKYVSAGNTDVLVTMVASTSATLWTKQFGGAGSDFIEAFGQIQGSTPLYFAGRADGTSNFDGTAIPSRGSFIGALNPDNGNSVWLTQMPTSASMFLSGIVSKPNQPIVFAGRAGGTIAFGAASCNARTAASGSSLFFGKIMPDGTVL